MLLTFLKSGLTISRIRDDLEYAKDYRAHRVPMAIRIDMCFDVRSDTPVGWDPDSYSPTLRQYHRTLWSKRLPDGRMFDLDDSVPGAYLCHRSDIGEFFLASDSVTPTFTRYGRMAHIIRQISEEERESFLYIASTIGATTVFPANRIDGQLTINGARGFTRKISDRFDLTVECIRRHYLGEPNPLEGVLRRYSDFFDLFGDFVGYVDFFLLQDIVAPDASAVRFFTQFDDFRTSPLPASLEEYVAYRERTIAFIEARNRRIGEWCGRQSAFGV